MWRKWNSYNGNRGPAIGPPVLIETTVDEGYLETIPEVDSMKSQRSSGMTLTEVPYRIVPPNHRAQQQHREPAWSPPLPIAPEHHAPEHQDTYEDQHPDISPVSSPLRSNPNTSSEDISISPIEPEKPFGSRLPLPRHEHRGRIPQRIVSNNKNKRSEASKAQKLETRWDAYSGEPTADNSGVPSSVRPGVQPLEHQYPQLRERTKQILAGLRDREALNRPGGNGPPSQLPPPGEPIDPLDHVVHREPWKGPSGRTALVDPVQNNPSARSGVGYQTQRSISRTKPDPIVTRADSPNYMLRPVASEESIKPVAPLKIATKSRNPSPQSSSGNSSPPFFDAIHSAPPAYQHPKTLQSPFSSPGPIKETEIPALPAATRADSPYDALPHTPRTPRTPTPPAIYQNTTQIKVPQMPSEPEVSRFSWTTYATSVTESPGSVARILRGESPPPPVPPVPQLHIKKRPLPDAEMNNSNLRNFITPSQSGVIIRKPVGGNPRPPSDMAFSELSLSKTLPQIPPEAEATDKMASFEAQMNALAMRKHNTTRIIRDLHESLRKNAIVYDLWKRRDVGERIANHERELQSITNEEHDIGLLLHRAQRKRDSNDNYETPTGLWIRRVTS